MSNEPKAAPQAPANAPAQQPDKVSADTKQSAAPTPVAAPMVAEPKKS